jgi:hypothetical protein
LHCFNLGQPARKGRKKKPWSRFGFQDLNFQDLDRRKKKTLVLTLGSPPQKGEKKKNFGPDLAFRTSTFRTWTDGEKKKPLVLTLGSPSEKGEKKKPWSRSGFQDLDFQNLKPRIGTSTDRRTHEQTSELI